MKNDVWEIVPRLEKKPVVTSKWIYKINHTIDGNIEKYNARFVARGFSQKERIDYEETFAPVVSHTSIRTIISLAAVMKWKIHQMDVFHYLLKILMVFANLKDLLDFHHHWIVYLHFQHVYFIP